MAADTGHKANVAKCVDTTGDREPFVYQKQVKTVANMYPARLVTKDTYDNAMKICDGVNLVPIGWLGHEQTDEKFQQDALTDIQIVNNKAACLRGGGFCVQAAMPKGFVARQGDTMFSAAAAGKVVPGCYVDGKPAMAVPFSQNATEVNTNIDLISGQVITDCFILVETAVSSGTIDVGIGMGTESGYDADGFVDGELTSVAGLIDHLLTWTTGSNNVYIKQSGDYAGGILINTIKYGADTAASSEDGTIIPIAYKCDGTCVSLCYTTSAHASIGRILFVFGRNPGIIEVGTAEETVDTTSAAANIWVLSKL